MAKKPRFKKRSSLSKKQKMEVRKIAEQVVDEEIEDKSFVFTEENGQLDHNKPVYVAKFLGDIEQGVSTGDQSTGGTGVKAIRLGDQIRLKNINIRMWISNKSDRPNVMYKAVLFWYPTGIAPADDTVYLTQTNKMLDRYNYKVIKVIDQVILNSTYNYSGQEKEKSYLLTLNKSYKNKLIQYNNNGTRPKGFDLGMAIVCYDAFGTLQSDNIASWAYQSKITYQDA